MCASPIGTATASPRCCRGLTPGFLQVWWFDQALAAKLAGVFDVNDGAARAHVRVELGAAALLVLALPPPRRPPHPKQKHGLSAFGDLAYPADFTHFAYANPDAPKGGTFSLVGWGGVATFNSLNNYILKGDAAQGLELLFDSLMTPAADEPDAVYGLVAESAEVADDRMSVTFHLGQRRISPTAPRSPPTTWCSHSMR